MDGSPSTDPHDRGRRPSRSAGDGPLGETALRTAFAAMGPEMVGFAAKSLSSRDLAEDAVQETFARAWRSRRRYDPAKGSLRTWLFAIERRVIIDLGTRRARATEQLDDDSPDPSGVDGLEQALVSWQVEAALNRLDPEHRRVLTELYFNGRSGREAALLLGVPEGTVRSRAFYALRSLRILMNEEGWEQ